MSLPFLKDLPKPWVLGQVPPPGRKKEPTTRPPALKEVTVPKYYYPYYGSPALKYRLRTNGSGVAVHPGGATSFVSPQVHGVGKRSATPAPAVIVRRSPMPLLPPYVYDPWRYPYYPHPHYRALVLPPSPYPASSFVYHRQSHKRSPLTSESEHGYSYGW